MNDRLRRTLSLILYASAFVLPLGSFQVNRIFSPEPITLYMLTGWLTGFLLLTILFSVIMLRVRYQSLMMFEQFYLIFLPTLVVYGLNLYQSGSASATQSVGLSISAYFVMVGAFLQLGTHQNPGIKTAFSLVVLLVLFGMGTFNQWGLYKEYVVRSQSFYTELMRHLSLSLSSVLTAFIPAVTLGYISSQHAKLREWILGFVNAFQVAPTLSMLALIMVPLTYISLNFPTLRAIGIRGIGFLPAFIVLTLYALLPITINALTAFTYVDESILESARGLGLTTTQILWKIRLPLAFPYLVLGFRIALIQTLGNALLAGLVGGGGMGSLIFLGLSQSAQDLILLGSLPIIALALSFELFFERIEHTLFKLVGVHHD
jgi:osmoprotectant transport system permease protein